MNLKQVSSEDLILINQNVTTKLEAIDILIDKLYDNGKIKSKEEFKKAVLERESLSETGIDKGLAIPHGKSSTVKQASVAILRNNTVIEGWESVEPTNKVQLVFLLAIPENEAGSTHLELLGKLMTKAQDDTFLNNLMKAKTTKELYDALEVSEEKKNNNVNYTKSIVAVTSCPAGMAHTYMAAEALVKAGEALGVKVYVEKQGSNGVEDKLTPKQLRDADACIIAADVAIDGTERFEQIPTLKTRVATPIKEGERVIQEALEKANKQGKGEVKVVKDVEEKTGFWPDVKESVLTGISYIIPVIIAGGMINCIALLLVQGFDLGALAGTEGSWLWLFKKMAGGLLGTLMIPLLSGYMAYSLGGKTALAPGFAAGIASNLINGGFLCGMLGGIVAGYAVRFLRTHIPAKGTLHGFISFWVYPVLSTLFVGVVIFLILGKPVAWLNQSLISILSALGGKNGALLGAVLGIMCSFDLGGPVNKAAYTFAVGAMAEGVYMPYAAFAGTKMVSGFAIAIATRLFKNIFTPEEREAGNSSCILVLAGITEGAIPFMMADPVRCIISLCAGSAVAGGIIGALNIGLPVPGSNIFSTLLLSDGVSPLVNGLVWVGAPLLGAVISAILLIVLRKAKLAKQAK